MRILSVIKLTRKGYKTENDHEKTVIKKPDGTTITAKVKNSAYMLKTRIVRAEAQVVQAQDKEETPTSDTETTDKPRDTSEHSIELWHKRLGHLHKEAMMHMVNHGTATGMKIKGKKELQACTSCIKGKSHHKPQSKKASHTSEQAWRHSPYGLLWTGTNYITQRTQIYYCIC
jgi:hypothetical protein